jgi:transmembrane sensor
MDGPTAAATSEMSEPPAPPPSTSAAPQRGRRRALLGAALVLAVAALTFAAWGETWRTGFGETRRIDLPNGVRVTLNAGTAVRAPRLPMLAPRLLKGEAWFDARGTDGAPRVVAAGGGRFETAGGAFILRRGAAGEIVQPTHGAVVAWRPGQASSRAAPDQRLMLAPGRPPRLEPDALGARRSLAWREGRIVLLGETLGYAMAEFNRYNALQIVIEDADLALEPVTGAFAARDPTAFTQAVARQLGAEVIREHDDLNLRRR